MSRLSAGKNPARAASHSLGVRDVGERRMAAPAEATTRTVLMLSYVFPPAAYVGGHRTAKYCKYLPLYGWRPVVVTIDSRHVSLQDTDLCRHLPDDLTILRTPDIDPAKWLDSLSSLRNRILTPRLPASSSPPAHHQLNNSKGGGSVSRLKRFVERALLRSPDSHVLWVPLAFLWGVRVLLTRKVDVIYSSSPPHSCHFAALLLAKCFRKPYVVDFRDPWFVTNSVRPGTIVQPPSPRLQSRLKRVVVAGASKVIAVSPGERDELRAEFPEIEGRRFVHITNGYDPDDFVNLVAVARDTSKFVLTHVGTVYAGVADEFFEALELLLRSHPELAQTLRVDLIGAAYLAANQRATNLIRAGTIVDHGFQPHAHALQSALASDVLVILAGGDVFLPSHLPAKVFEYMRLARPILAVTREGELSRLLAASGTGIVVPPKDPGRLAAAIWDLYINSRSNQVMLNPKWNVIVSFERRSLTASLASALDEVSSSDRATESTHSLLEVR